MAEFKFLSTSRVKVNDMIKDTRSYINRLYGRTSELFTTASPFSQSPFLQFLVLGLKIGIHPWFQMMD